MPENAAGPPYPFPRPSRGPGARCFLLPRPGPPGVWSVERGAAAAEAERRVRLSKVLELWVTKEEARGGGGGGEEGEATPPAGSWFPSTAAGRSRGRSRERQRSKERSREQRSAASHQQLWHTQPHRHSVGRQQPITTEQRAGHQNNPSPTPEAQWAHAMWVRRFSNRRRMHTRITKRAPTGGRDVPNRRCR